MKYAFITMIICYIFVFWLGIPFANFIFPWGNVEQSYLKTIYLGIIFLSGLIVGCTCYIAARIKELKSNESDRPDESDE